jgi:hypothetical protein
MDDSFAFRTTVPHRRQVSPRLVKAAIGLGIFLLAIGVFARWVMASERRSFGARPVPATAVPLLEVEVSADPAATPADAREAVRIALTAARAAFTERRTFLDAEPARLSELQPGYSFVDGPSTMPKIVSVASTEGAWAAAVMAPDGTCLWIRATSGGDVVRGVGTECTGTAALASLGHR